MFIIWRHEDMQLTHPGLSRQKRGERNRWDIEYGNWNLRRKEFCMFTDESWKKLGMRYNDQLVLQICRV